MTAEEQLAVSKEAFDLVKDLVEATEIRHYIKSGKSGLKGKKAEKANSFSKFRIAACMRRLQEIECELDVNAIIRGALKKED